MFALDLDPFDKSDVIPAHNTNPRCNQEELTRYLKNINRKRQLDDEFPTSQLTDNGLPDNES